MASLVNGTFPTVKSIAPAAFGPDELYAAGIFPRVTASVTDGGPDASQLYSAWRSETDRGLEIAYLLNPRYRFNF